MERERELVWRASRLEEELLAAGYESLPPRPEIPGRPWYCGTMSPETDWWLRVPGQRRLRRGRESIDRARASLAWARRVEQGLPALEAHVEALLDFKRVRPARPSAR